MYPLYATQAARTLHTLVHWLTIGYTHAEGTKIPPFFPNYKCRICCFADWGPVCSNKRNSERIVPSRTAPRSIARQQFNGLQEVVESALDLTSLLVAGSLFVEFLSSRVRTVLSQTWPGILAGGCDNSWSSSNLIGCSLYTLSIR